MRILSWFHCRHYDLLKQLRNIFVINNHRYAPFVVIIIRSFPHWWLIVWFVTRVTRRWKNYLPVRSNRVHLWFLVGFVLLDLQFSVLCFVDHCVSISSFFFFFAIVWHSPFSDLRHLITPLLSSNFSFT